MSIQSLESELQKLRAREAELAKRLHDVRRRQLSELPGKVGLKTVEALIEELSALSATAPKAAAKQPRVAAKKPAAPAAAKKAPAPAPAKKEPVAKKEPAPKKEPAAKKAPKAAAARPRGSKGRFSPELKEKVKAALVAGKSSPAVAREFGVSIPSISIWKREWGLTKSRAKKK